GAIHGRAALHPEAHRDRGFVCGRTLTAESDMTEQRHYRIAVLGGTGAQGSGLGSRLAQAGHAGPIGSRAPSRARDAAAELTSRIGKPIAGADYGGASAGADIVILTVPYAAQQATVEAVRDELQGKILVDATVPLVPPKVSVVALPEGRSAVAAIQELVGNNVRVVSAFQNVSAPPLA